MHDVGPFFSILRFCHARGQIKRWGAVRHVKRSGISMRVFLVFIVFIEKNRLQTSGRFMISGRFLKKMVFPENAPEVSGRCLGPSLTY